MQGRREWFWSSAMALIRSTEPLLVTARAKEAAIAGHCGEHLRWVFEENGGILTISGKGKMWHFDGSREMAAPWFGAWHDSIKEVLVAEGVTSIGAHAFDDCCNLVRAALPNSVTAIGAAAFMDCDKLANIVLPAGVTEIGWSAFSGCCSLRCLKIPESVSSISDTMFFNCAKLEEIILPEGVKSIGMSAFVGCVNLRKVTLPAGITAIGNRAFHDCSSLTVINYPGAKEQWEAIQIGEGAIAGSVRICFQNQANAAMAFDLSAQA